MAKEYVLELGKYEMVSPKMIMKQPMFLLYAGMPTPTTFSVGISNITYLDTFKHSIGHNLYFPKSVKQINITGYIFDVVKITKSELTIRFVGKE